MGLRGFYALLKRCGYTPDDADRVHLMGKTVAIDGDFIMYQALHGGTTGPEVDAGAISRRIATWLQAAEDQGIRVIFVVSGGAPPHEKTVCLAGRATKREATRARISTVQATMTQTVQTIAENPASPSGYIALADLQDTNERLCGRVRHISRSTAEAVTGALEARGFLCRRAVSEADFMLTDMSETGACDLVATDDADILVAGAKTLVRGFVAAVMGGRCRIYHRAAVLRALQLTNAQVLQLATLLACDYQPPLQQVGAATALRIIQDHQTVAAFLMSEAFVATTQKSKKRRYALPVGVDDCAMYIRKTARTIEILRGRPDRTPVPVQKKYELL